MKKEIKDAYQLLDIMGGELSGDFKSDLKKLEANGYITTTHVYNEAYMLTMMP